MRKSVYVCVIEDVTTDSYDLRNAQFPFFETQKYDRDVSN